MDADAVASRSGAPIEHAKDAVKETGSAGKDAEEAAAVARTRNSSPSER
ncbi:hypothetical protein [Aureimonas leprariae]|nr:hypothetical protein [Aureimonas leprariae]